MERRRTVIKSHDLAAWYRAVMDLENTTLRDFLLLTLFTRLRREEAARLRWANVDLKGRALTVPDTKNGEPHTLPLSGFLLELLERRKEGAGCGVRFPWRGCGGPHRGAPCPNAQGDGADRHSFHPGLSIRWKREIQRLKVWGGEPPQNPPFTVKIRPKKESVIPAKAGIL